MIGMLNRLSGGLFQKSQQSGGPDKGESRKQPPYFKFVTAHRGARYGEKKLPENLRETLLGKDVKAGRINLETDVYTPTDSDELFIKHDGLLTGRDIGPKDPGKRVYDLTTAEMASLTFNEDNLKAHEEHVNRKLGTDHLPEGHPERYVADKSLLGERIATLQEIADGMGDNVHLYINYKASREETLNGDQPSRPDRPSNNGIERKVVDFINKNDLKDRSTVLVTSPTSLDLIKAYDQDVKTGLLTDWLNKVPKPVRDNPVLYRMVLYPYMLRAKMDFNPKPLEKLLGKPLGIGADSVHPNYKQANDAYAAVAARLGFDEMTAWASRETRDEELAEVRRLHDIAGRHDIPVGVITDIPDEALDIANQSAKPARGESSEA